MAKEVTRYIKREVERELWARAAGRCQFNGCNRPLYKSPVTQEQANISEKAHVYSYAKNGPRGWGPFITNKKALNHVPNLMLVCHDCHNLIDQEQDGGRYTAAQLLKWKDEHEKRVAINTGIDPSKKSHVVLYGANIGDEISKLQPEHCKEALFPRMNPADERTICLSMSWEGKDDKPEYWVTESGNLDTTFNKEIRPLIKEGNPSHFSVFTLAPMPLMIKLGALFTEKNNVDVYQLHREPHPTWHWLQGPTPTDFIVKQPVETKSPPVLVISLSDSIAHDRVWSVVGKDISLWELTIERPHNDFLKSMDQLSQYREAVRGLLAAIGQAHGIATPLSIFPAMPVACAVELGRVRMPKACMPLVIYDQNSKLNKFISALTIGGHDE